eukprot:15444077-Alexandrium_andersonii.AAC.1
MSSARQERRAYEPDSHAVASVALCVEALPCSAPCSALLQRCRTIALFECGAVSAAAKAEGKSERMFRAALGNELSA